MSGSGHSRHTVRKRLERRERELEAARRISQALFQHLRVEDVVEQALRIALEVVEADAGCVLLANPETRELVFFHAIGAKSPPRGTAFSWDQGIAGTVFQNGEAMVVGNVKQDSRHFSNIDIAFGHITQDLIALPLKQWEGNPIGVLEVMNKRTGHLDQDDVAILTLISAFTAIAIETARYFEEVKVAQVAHVLGDIGHDIKNMMMPIIFGSWLLQNKIENLSGKIPEKEKHELNIVQELDVCQQTLLMVRNNASRIQDRVKAIADAVKGLTSPVSFSPCEISLVVNAVIETLGPMAKEKGINLEVEELLTLPRILADERRLFNAFYNLINNAIDEVQPGGSVTIHGRQDPHAIVLSVKDTGPGMLPEVYESLFTTRVISQKTGGTGLGTKIVKDVVDAHGGQITVESQVGVGTTFHIYLPIQPQKH